MRRFSGPLSAFNPIGDTNTTKFHSITCPPCPYHIAISSRLLRVFIKGAANVLTLVHNPKSSYSFGSNYRYTPKIATITGPYENESHTNSHSQQRSPNHFSSASVHHHHQSRTYRTPSINTSPLATCCPSNSVMAPKTKRTSAAAEEGSAPATKGKTLVTPMDEGTKALSSSGTLKKKSPVRPTKKVDAKNDCEELSSSSIVGHGKKLSRTSSKVYTFTPPPNWRELYDAVKTARKTIDAPVDTIGCHMLKDPNASLEDQRFQTLLSLLLSSQTRDQCTSAAMKNLISHNGCTVKTMNDEAESKIKDLISGVCFYNNKARYIKAVTQIIADKHKGIVPRDYDTLVSLPGLGPKMIHIFMSTDGVITGIGVDVHVHRIAQRFGWVPSAKYNNVGLGVKEENMSAATNNKLKKEESKVKSEVIVKEEEKEDEDEESPSNGLVGGVHMRQEESGVAAIRGSPPVKTPEDTRAYLESWMPRELWGEVNVMLVGYGQTVCPAVSPRCGECKVSHLCPNAFQEGKEARVGAIKRRREGDDRDDNIGEEELKGRANNKVKEQAIKASPIDMEELCARLEAKPSKTTTRRPSKR